MNNAINEYENALAREIEALKSKFTIKQLDFASWLYVYALDCNDEKAKEKYPACRAMLEAESRLYELSERLGLEDGRDIEIDDDVYRALGIGDGEKATFERLGL